MPKVQELRPELEQARAVHAALTTYRSIRSAGDDAGTCEEFARAGDLREFLVGLLHWCDQHDVVLEDVLAEAEAEYLGDPIRLESVEQACWQPALE